MLWPACPLLLLAVTHSRCCCTSSTSSRLHGAEDHPHGGVELAVQKGLPTEVRHEVPAHHGTACKLARGLSQMRASGLPS